MMSDCHTPSVFYGFINLLKLQQSFSLPNLFMALSI